MLTFIYPFVAFYSFFVQCFRFLICSFGYVVTIDAKSHKSEKNTRTTECFDILPLSKNLNTFLLRSPSFFYCKTCKAIYKCIRWVTPSYSFFLFILLHFFTARYHISPKTCLFWGWFYSYSLVRLEWIVVIQTRKQLLKLFSFGWQNTRIKRKW